MYFILMLTQHDETVPNCLDMLEQVLPLDLRHIGFKDVGVSHETLIELNRRIKSAGATSYMEVVSETSAACLNSARTAAEIGVDRLLGGTDIGAVKAILSGTGIAYFPFPGHPVDHPTRLEGRPEDIAKDCRAFMAEGCAGADLLAYRAVDAEPIDLVKAARTALEGGDWIGALRGCVHARARRFRHPGAGRPRLLVAPRMNDAPARLLSGELDADGPSFT